MNRGYSAIGLFYPKNDVNVAGVLRACSVYQSSMLVTCGKRYKKHSADTSVYWKHMPFIQNATDLRDYIPYDCVPVAVELVTDAQSLVDYVHPQRAFYVFGPEDGTLGHQVTDWCRDTVYVPGSHCMNLAATVNVVLYDRLSKQLRLKDE